MISSVLIPLARLAALVRHGLLVSLVLGGSATAAYAADPAGPAGAGNGNVPAPVDPLAHSKTSDRYVNGKYDKTGTYIPPHYQPVQKPRFRGYFFNKEEGGDKAQNPADQKPN